MRKYDEMPQPVEQTVDAVTVTLRYYDGTRMTIRREPLELPPPSRPVTVIVVGGKTIKLIETLQNEQGGHDD